ncbi:hypothetical protein CCP4SC76_6240001 [Gammaproteobacteria bacterium]
MVTGTDGVSDQSDSTFTVSSRIVSQPSVTYPNGGENWTTGQTQVITWSGFTSSNVRLDLYLNGSLSSTIAASTSNDGSYSWSIPTSQTASSGYKVVVTGTDGVSDQSDSTFTVNSQVVSQPTVTYPNGGENWTAGQVNQIRWSGFSSSALTLMLYLDDQGLKTIVEGTANNGLFSWVVPSDLKTASTYKMLVWDKASGVYDFSDSNFTITSPSIDVHQLCKDAYANLDRAKTIGQPMVIGHYTDILTLPNLKTECSHTHDECNPFAGYHTTCEWCSGCCGLGFWCNCKNECNEWGSVCDAYTSYKQVMNCNIVFDFKSIPFINMALDTVSNVASDLQGMIPAQCMAGNGVGVSDPNQQVVQQIIDSIRQQIEQTVRQTAEEVASRWAVETIISIIPSFGTSIVATTAVEIVNFLNEVYDAIQPILDFIDDAKEFGEGMGLRTDCKWGPWEVI